MQRTFIYRAALNALQGRWRVARMYFTLWRVCRLPEGF
jgi:hypothetical protein